MEHCDCRACSSLLQVHAWGPIETKVDNGPDNGDVFDSREYETISIDPIRVRRIEVHEFVEQDVSNRGHAHWGARVARICLEGCIDLSIMIQLAIDFSTSSLVQQQPSSLDA